jgi:hypothetical protein
MAISELVRGTTSNAFAQLEDAKQGNLLLLECLNEQHFPGIGSATGSDRRASTEKNIAVATSDLRDFIAFEFSLVQEVEYVFTAFRENQIFYAWIITDDFESSVRESVYERQQAIIDEFPMFEFDFYIIARKGRHVEELIGDESMHLTYARKIGAEQG